MKRLSAVSFSVLCLSAMLVGGCAAQSAAPDRGDVVAIVNDNRPIYFPQLQHFAIERYYDGRSHDRVQSYRDALDRMIIEELKWRDFFNQGLHEDRELLRRIMRNINEELILVYFQEHYAGRYINEDAIRSAYQEMGREVRFNQVVLRKPNAYDDQDIDALRSLAEKIRSQADQGEDLLDLAAQSASHYIDRQRTGEMIPVTWESSVRNRAEEIVFGLAQGETRVFETSDALSIVKVIDLRDRAVPPLITVREEIETALTHRYLPAAIAEYESDKAQILDANSIEWYEEGIQRILLLARSEGFFERRYQAVISDALARGDNPRILVHSDGVVDLREYKRLLDEVLLMTSAASLEADDIKAHITEALRTEALADRARSAGLESRILDPSNTSEVIRNRIVWLYDQHFIAPQIPDATEEALRTFYAENTDSLFYQFETVNTYVLLSDDRQEVEAWKERAEAGTAFRDIIGRHYVKSFYRDRSGDVQSLYSAEPPHLGEEAFAMDLNDVRGPVSYDDDEGVRWYALIKKVGEREERELTYEEVEERLARAFRQHYWESAQDRLDNRLRAQYTVDVFEDVLMRQLAAHEIR